MADDLRPLVRATYNNSLRDDHDTQIAFGRAVSILRARRPLLGTEEAWRETLAMLAE